MEDTLAVKFIATLLLLLTCSAWSAQFTNSTSATIQTSLTNASVAAGDTIWIRGGTYTPPNSNAASMGEPQWTVTLKGATNSLITIRGYPGEAARLDRQWRFGTSSALRFQDLEFFDSFKGSNPTNGSFPNGPWLHFDGSLADTTNEWINCVIHDTGNVWSGGTAGRLVRGCIIWYAGLNSVEHVAYSTGLNWVGNISAWTSGSTIQLGVAGNNISSNIAWGSGITDNSANKEFLLTLSSTFSNNVCWEKATLSTSALYHNGGTITAQGNKIVSQSPVVLSGDQAVTFLGNTLYQNDSSAGYPVIRRLVNSVGAWSVNNNAYWSANTVTFENTNLSRTFAQWKSDYAGFDTTSTSTNSAKATNSVSVFVDADTAKRASIAVFNGTAADNVSVSLSGVLSSGDTYLLYSAQNYGTAIQAGTYNGSSISVPMTNLGVATVLYSTNWGLTTPATTSPEFGAFVVVGSAVASGITANTGPGQSRPKWR